MYSAAEGILNSRFGCANTTGAVGVTGSTAAASISDMASFSGSMGSVVSGVDSASASSIFTVADWAATSVTVAPENAGIGTRLSSSQSAASTTMRPSLSYENFVGLTPTLTSMTPSAARISASSPAAVREIRMEASISVPVSTRSATIPTGRDGSWYMNTRGDLPSTGRLPGLNITSVPSDTVANVLYGTAMASMRRSPDAPALAVTPRTDWVSWIILRSFLGCSLGAGRPWWIRRPCRRS